MPPTATINDCRNICERTIVAARKIALEYAFRIPRPDFSDAVFCKACLGVLFSVCVAATLAYIPLVFSASPPGKISQSAIGPYRVEMTAFHALWAGTDECLQDKSMNLECLISAAFQWNEIDSEIASLVFCQFHQFPFVGKIPLILPAAFPAIPNSSVVSNAISGESGDVSILYLSFDSAGDSLMIRTPITDCGQSRRTLARPFRLALFYRTDK